MAEVNLNKTDWGVDTGKSSIVIIRDLGDLVGGRSLNVEGWAGDVIKAGHVIVKDTATGDYLPLAVSGEAYAAATSGQEYVGVLKTDVLAKKAFAPIMTIGQVNAAASPYPVTDAIAEGLPLIQFMYR